MTRFARARGSKSSNERVPEQATSWNEMRRELLRESVRKAAEEQIERESQSQPSKTEVERHQSACTSVRKSTEPVEFASFDEDIQSKNVSKNIPHKIMKGKVTKKLKNQETYSETKQNVDDDFLYQRSFKEVIVSSPPGQELFIKEGDSHDDKPHGKMSASPAFSSEKFNNNKFQGKAKNNSNEWKSTVGDKRNLVHQDKSKQDDDPMSKISGIFRGYPVPLEDAEILNDAYKILRKEGLTHQKAMEQIKPERRRAEKRLARLKAMTCFRCRNVGHKLSDCPLGNVDCDVCFKCGSTTHKYQDCKKKGSFVNANCFICGETGHLSSQCPDNPHGVYPKGGQCKVCGEKSHLVKDCPQNKKKKEVHPGSTEFDDYFEDGPSAGPSEPKRKKLKKVEF